MSTEVPPNDEEDTDLHKDITDDENNVKHDSNEATDASSTLPTQPVKRNQVTPNITSLEELCGSTPVSHGPCRQNPAPPATMLDGEYEGSVDEEGNRKGQGKLVLRNGDILTCMWLNNLPHGSGCMTFVDGSTFRGNWKEGILTGYGEYRSSTVTAKGYFLNNFGKGTVRKEDESVYRGEFDWRGKYHGTGILHYRTGPMNLWASKEGTWMSGRPHGIITWVTPVGNVVKSLYIKGHVTNRAKGKYRGQVLAIPGSYDANLFRKSYYGIYQILNRQGSCCSCMGCIICTLVCRSVCCGCQTNKSTFPA